MWESMVRVTCGKKYYLVGRKRGFFVEELCGWGKLSSPTPKTDLSFCQVTRFHRGEPATSMNPLKFAKKTTKIYIKLGFHIFGSVCFKEGQKNGKKVYFAPRVTRLHKVGRKK